MSLTKDTHDASLFTRTSSEGMNLDSVETWSDLDQVA